MSDLKEDLDRALRTVTFSAAPIEQAKRDGRRIRTRRRLSVVAGALAVAAVAAGYPALTRTAAAPPAPATGQPAHPSPAKHDPVITAGPSGATTEAPTGLASKTGAVAVGKMGAMAWRLTADARTAGNPGSTYCFSVNPDPAHINQSSCGSLPDPQLGELSSSSPVSFTGAGANGVGVTVGEAASTVTYVIVTFTDTQQVKLIPVTVHGHRYIAWAAPLSMQILSIDAHLGGPYNDSGQMTSMVPFYAGGGSAPAFGLWQSAGQPTPPRATGVIGHGTAGGQVWSVTAHEGPWGTCFVAATGGASVMCVPSAKLGLTELISGVGDMFALPEYGSAAPGVASLVIKMSDGTSTRVRSVRVGNENLFALWVGQNVTITGWTTYDASGKQTGTGTIGTFASGTATKSASP